MRDKGVVLSDKKLRGLLTEMGQDTKKSDGQSIGSLPCNYYGWQITLTPDGLGLVIVAPEGKRLSMVDGRFVVSEGGKRLEVRAK